MKAEVSAYLRPTASGECRIVNLNLLADGVRVTWNDGHASFFHHVWLRDCCYCEACGDSYSSKRFFVPGDMPLEPSARDAVIDGDGALAITWEADGHRSRFDPAWLRQHCYDDRSRQARRARPTPWDAALEADPPRVELASAASSDAARMDLYRKLRDFGLVVVHGAPAKPGFIRDVAALVGEMGADTSYGEIFDLTPSSRVRTMGNTFRPVPPHTDEAFRYTPPGLNILGCIRPAEKAGESVFVDGIQCATLLRRSDPDAFSLLSGHAHSYHRRHDDAIDQQARMPILSLDDEGCISGIRLHTRASAPLDLPPDLVPPYYAAYRQICELVMARTNQVHLVLQAGEAVIFDNHRVLHGRGGFEDSARFLQLCNVSREGFHERLRLLALRLGLHTEAHQVLGGGVVT